MSDLFEDPVLGQFSWSFVLVIVKLQRRFRILRQKVAALREQAALAERQQLDEEIRVRQAMRKLSTASAGHRRAISLPSAMVPLSSSSFSTMAALPESRSVLSIVTPEPDGFGFKFSWKFVLSIVRLQRKFRALRRRVEERRLAQMRQEQLGVDDEIRQKMLARFDLVQLVCVVSSFSSGSGDLCSQKSEWQSILNSPCVEFCCVKPPSSLGCFGVLGVSNVIYPWLVIKELYNSKKKNEKEGERNQRSKQKRHTFRWKALSVADHRIQTRTRTQRTDRPAPPDWARRPQPQLVRLQASRTIPPCWQVN
jgi:hypothetical protein